MLRMRVAGAKGCLAAIHEKGLVAYEGCDLLVECGDLRDEVATRLGRARLLGGIVVGGEEDASDAGYDEAMVLLCYKAEVRVRYSDAMGVGSC